MKVEAAERLAPVKAYFFARLGKRINEMRAAGMDVIRMDMGSPDLPPPDFVVDALVESARKPDVHGYTLGSGTQSFRQAVADHYSRRFGVELDAGSQVIDLIGSKEGLFILSQAVLNPGDLALTPDPAYAVYAMGARIAGADTHSMPLLAENDFLPDLEAIPEEVLERAKLLWISYPNNPTGAVADMGFFERTVALARKHNFLVAHDAPYTEVGFDGYRAPSLMQVEGAAEVAVEFNSFSKAYNMAGWRLGMAVGNEKALSLVETYKSQQDSAIFAPIMAAGEAALHSDPEWIEERNKVYRQRRDVVLEGLRAAGFQVETPRAALYVWAPLPVEEASKDFCSRLLEDTGVSTTPGSVFGQYGEGYLRISLVTDVERLAEGTRRMAEWMAEKA